VFGDSLFALRFFPAAAGAAVVLLTGLMARQLGGGWYAQCLAALTAIIAPIYLAVGGLLGTVVFDQFFWVLCTYILLVLLNRENPRLWLLIGLVFGIGLLNKYTMLFYGLGLFAGLLLTDKRKYFRSKWLWLGGLIAFIIYLPNLIWQVNHDWPTVEFLGNLDQHTSEEIPRSIFLGLQVLLIHPFALPIWLIGLGHCFLSKSGSRYRVLGWIYLVAFLALLALQGKAYYLAPAYPALLASGAVVIAGFIQQRNWAWLKPALVSILMVGGAITAPISLPILSVDKLDDSLILEINGELGDMVGWDELVASVAEAYSRLPAEEQARAGIFTSNYGSAGAINFLGEPYKLPEAISGHNNYYLWGPGNTEEVEVYIGVGFSEEFLKTFFNEVEKAGTITNRYGIENEEYNQPFFYCRSPKMSISEAWPQLKHYN
jgi:4-amino-4-deoxy-L-arabinose transferase-like glycosyltransferase